MNLLRNCPSCFAPLTFPNLMNKNHCQIHIYVKINPLIAWHICSTSRYFKGSTSPPVQTFKVYIPQIIFNRLHQWGAIFLHTLTISISSYNYQ